MAHQIFTAANYRDALVKLDQFLTNRHVATVAVNAGGAGYAVDDVLTVAGGTVVNGLAATLEVTSVASGVIDGVRVLSWGAYSVDPTTTANAATGGTGAGATFDLTVIAAQWTQRIANISTSTDIVSITAGSPSAQGTGYVANDVVTLDTSAPNTGEATFTVTSVDGSGRVLSLTPLTPGNYSGSVSGIQATTGGTGSNLTMNITFLPTRDEYWWEGVGTGGQAVFAGIRSGVDIQDDQRLWELAGGSGWGGNSDWEAQPGISPGRNDLINDDGNVMFMSENVQEFRVFASARRVIIVANIDGSIQSGHIGLLDPYGTESEVPYPFYVAGTYNRFDENISQNAVVKRGFVDPTSSNVSQTVEGAFFRDGGGSWRRVTNGGISGSGISDTQFGTIAVYPCGRINTAQLDDADQFANTTTGRNWLQVIDQTRVGTAPAVFMPSPDSGGDIYWPIPCVLFSHNEIANYRTLGEINGAFWISAASGLSSGDKITIAGIVYRVFQMGTNTEAYSHFAVIEG